LRRAISLHIFVTEMLKYLLHILLLILLVVIAQLLTTSARSSDVTLYNNGRLKDSNTSSLSYCLQEITDQSF
jgi:hypothetical protein